MKDLVEAMLVTIFSYIAVFIAGAFGALFFSKSRENKKLLDLKYEGTRDEAEKQTAGWSVVDLVARNNSEYPDLPRGSGNPPKGGEGT